MRQAYRAVNIPYTWARHPRVTGASALYQAMCLGCRLANSNTVFVSFQVLSCYSKLNNCYVVLMPDIKSAYFKSIWDPSEFTRATLFFEDVVSFFFTFF